MLIKFKDKSPYIGKNVKIFPGAYIIGDCKLEDNVSVWFNSILRADYEKIVIGKNTNIQDLVMIHTDTNFPTVIGEYCTIAHHVVIHGCTIKDNTLIGMNSTILNGAVIGSNCIIGANSLVTSNTIIPDNSLVFGNPAKVIRTLTTEEINYIKENAVHYIKLSSTYS